MTIFNVRVRRGPFSGTADDGARLNIVASVSQVNHEEHTLEESLSDLRDHE